VDISRYATIVSAGSYHGRVIGTQYGWWYQDGHGRIRLEALTQGIVGCHAAGQYYLLYSGPQGSLYGLADQHIDNCLLERRCRLFHPPFFALSFLLHHVQQRGFNSAEAEIVALLQPGAGK